MRLSAFYRSVLAILLLWVSVLALVSIARLYLYGIGVDAAFFGALAQAVGIFLASGAVFYVGWEALVSRRVNLWVLLPVGLAFYGVVLGIMNLEVHSSPTYVLKHLYLVLFAALFVFFGTHFWRCDGMRCVKVFMHVTLGMNLVSVAVFHVLSKVIILYPGYGTGGPAYAGLFYLVTGRPLLFFLTSGVIMMQGKRSIMLPYFGCCMLFLAVRYLRCRHVFPLILLPLAAAVLIFGAIEHFDLYALPGLDMLRYINLFSDDFDLIMGSSGRLDEYASALLALEQYPMAQYIGAGFGFHFEWDHGGATLSQGYVHNSPLLIGFLLGPLPAIALYVPAVYLGIKGVIVHQQIRRPQSFDFIFTSLGSLFFLISSLFALGILADPFGLLLIGATLASFRVTPPPAQEMAVRHG
jgi:hypothetical protein